MAPAGRAETTRSAREDGARQCGHRRRAGTVAGRSRAPRAATWRRRRSAGFVGGGGGGGAGFDSSTGLDHGLRRWRRRRLEPGCGRQRSSSGERERRRPRRGHVLDVLRLHRPGRQPRPLLRGDRASGHDGRQPRPLRRPGRACRAAARVLARPGTVAVVPGEELRVYVGGRARAATSQDGGYNGGGRRQADRVPEGRGGGGATDIRRAPYTESTASWWPAAVGAAARGTPPAATATAPVPIGGSNAQDGKGGRPGSEGGAGGAAGTAAGGQRRPRWERRRRTAVSRDRLPGLRERWRRRRRARGWRRWWRRQVRARSGGGGGGGGSSLAPAGTDHPGRSAPGSGKATVTFSGPAVGPARRLRLPRARRGLQRREPLLHGHRPRGRQPRRDRDARRGRRRGQGRQGDRPPTRSRPGSSFGCTWAASRPGAAAVTTAAAPSTAGNGGGGASDIRRGADRCRRRRGGGRGRRGRRRLDPRPAEGGDSDTVGGEGSVKPRTARAAARQHGRRRRRRRRWQRHERRRRRRAIPAPASGERVALPAGIRPPAVAVAGCTAAGAAATPARIRRAATSSAAPGGGGGGSSLFPGGSVANGVNAGNGQVTITFRTVNGARIGHRHRRRRRRRREHLIDRRQGHGQAALGAFGLSRSAFAAAPVGRVGEREEEAQGARRHQGLLPAQRGRDGPLHRPAQGGRAQERQEVRQAHPQEPQEGQVHPLGHRARLVLASGHARVATRSPSAAASAARSSSPARYRLQGTAKDTAGNASKLQQKAVPHREVLTPSGPCTPCPTACAQRSPASSTSARKAPDHVDMNEVLVRPN